uniref:Prostate stem cell antigen n=1 Tax=Bos mutus grunniens TaxID=30521 RepID=A0A8B9WFJ5_BOSMU
AANLALQPGTALQCYSCEDQGNNEGCQRVQNCNQCWTEHVEGISLLTVISKGCSSHCVEDSGNSFGSKKNIACCSTDLCNASRAQALQPAGVTQVLLGAPGHLLLWGRAQL